MDRATAIAQIREATKQIALQMMKIHPAIRHLGDPTTQDECVKSLHELTVQLEVIKKKVGKLEREDSSTDL